MKAWLLCAFRNGRAAVACMMHAKTFTMQSGAGCFIVKKPTELFVRGNSELEVGC